MRKRTMTLLLALLLATGAACSQQTVPRAVFTDDGDYLPPPSGPGLVSQARSPIPDVPLPVGFVAVPSRSESSADGQARYVHHVYQGRSIPAEVVSFYRRQLPRHGWESQGRHREDDGTVVMRYTKGREALEARVSERHGTITTTVTIEPRS